MSSEPLRPEWPINVLVFKPSDEVKKIQAHIKPTEDPLHEYKLKNGETRFTHKTDHHFDTKHYALLFEPGEYNNCSFEVGYYVQMIGLGQNAGAVRFTGENSGPYVEALNKDKEGSTNQKIGDGLCLDTFWRSIENFTSENTQWAVSQAAPIRNVHITHTLTLGDKAAYSSGGFLANAKVDNLVDYCANQQWFSRACDLKQVSGGSWSLVFSGCTGEGIPEDNTWKENVVTTVDETPAVRVEKPYIAINTEGNYELHVPKPTTVIGAQLDGSNNEIRSFSNVKVGKPILPMKNGIYVNHSDETYNDLSKEDEILTQELQRALDEGKDLLLCPGIFFLTRSLVIKYTNQIILGLGLATLVAPQDGSPCIKVQPKTAGVRLAGLVLEASIQRGNLGKDSDDKSCLLSIGDLETIDDAGDPMNPVTLSDIFTRVGGSNLNRSVETDIMVRVHSGNVIGDNLWLWRADHVRLRPGEKPNDETLDLYHQVGWERDEAGRFIKIDECMTRNAIEILGNDVKMYGLFCEHAYEHQCIWKGERGSTTFFQCELPYDADHEFANSNYTGYYVDKGVKKHIAKAIGVYSNFRAFEVKARSGMHVPTRKGIVLQNPFTVFLDNKGTIGNIVDLNGLLVGGAASTHNKGKPSRAWIGKVQF